MLSKKDSFSQFVSDFKQNYLSYQKSLLQERRVFKSLTFKTKQLQLKSEFLFRNLQETKTELLEKISEIKELSEDDFNSLPRQDKSDLLNFFSIAVTSSPFCEILSKIDDFDPCNIPESAIKGKISESNIEEKDSNIVKTIINLCIEWRMKNDLLKVYESEIQRIGKSIENKRNEIKELEGKINEFVQNNQLDVNEYLETKEQQDEMVINSDELYGEMRIAADTSTIIFEEPRVCGRCCLIL
jgi:hypothetical protein